MPMTTVSKINDEWRPHSPARIIDADGAEFIAAEVLDSYEDALKVVEENPDEDLRIEFLEGFLVADVYIGQFDPNPRSCLIKTRGNGDWGLVYDAVYVRFPTGTKVHVVGLPTAVKKGDRWLMCHQTVRNSNRGRVTGWRDEEKFGRFEAYR